MQRAALFRSTVFGGSSGPCFGRFGVVTGRDWTELDRIAHPYLDDHRQFPREDIELEVATPLDRADFSGRRKERMEGETQQP